MFRLMSLAALTLACLAVTGPAAEKKVAVKKAEAIELFNGKNLDGWKVFLNVKDARSEDTWSVEKGVIICKGKPAGYIVTEKDYGNYILELEWKWPEKPGNSGVLLHVTGEDKIWPKSIEAQLMANNAGDFWLIGGVGFKVDPARKMGDRRFIRLKTDKAVEKKPGEWNQYRITCDGDRIKLEINGQVVNEGTGAELTRGKIALQSEGAEIHFRNIKLTSK